jgi:hypothetical protein
MIFFIIFGSIQTWTPKFLTISGFTSFNTNPVLNSNLIWNKFDIFVFTKFSGYKFGNKYMKIYTKNIQIYTLKLGNMTNTYIFSLETYMLSLITYLLALKCLFLAFFKPKKCLFSLYSHFYEYQPFLIHSKIHKLLG